MEFRPSRDNNVDKLILIPCLHFKQAKGKIYMTEENPYACWKRMTSPVVCQTCLDKARLLGDVEADVYMKLAEMYNSTDHPILSYAGCDGLGFEEVKNLEHAGFLTSTESGYYSLKVKPLGYEKDSRGVKLHISCRKNHLSGNTGEISND